MSDDFSDPGYFTREAFAARMTARRAGGPEPAPVAVFWHCAVMPGAADIVREQVALFAHAGVPPVRAVVLTEPGKLDEGVDLVNVLAACAGAPVEVVGAADDLSRCEGPTVVAAYDWARANPAGAVVYCHTKGASAPRDGHKRHWRRAMARRVVFGWRDCVRRLAEADTVGCCWQDNYDFPHWCGNFWAARADWLARLPDPRAYPLSRPDFAWAGAHSWRGRMWPETWVGSRPWHHVGELVGTGFPMWSDRVYELPVDVPGFDYSLFGG